MAIILRYKGLSSMSQNNGVVFHNCLPLGEQRLPLGEVGQHCPSHGDNGSRETAPPSLDGPFFNHMKNNNTPTFQVMVFGAPHVGKSALRERFLRDFLQRPHVKKRDLRRSVGATVGKMELLDSYDDEFVGLRDMHIMSCQGFILIYRVDSVKSFRALLRYHEQIKRVKDVPYFPLLLLGNKPANRSREISQKEVQEYALQSQAGHLELCLKEATPEQMAIPFQIILRLMEEHADSIVPLRKKRGRARRQVPKFISLGKKLSWSLHRSRPFSSRDRERDEECINLPKELWMNIFQYLSHGELCEIQLVCTHWYNIIAQCMKEDWFRRKRMQSLYILSLED